MEDKELKGLLIEIVEAVNDLAKQVQSITPPSDPRIAEDREHTAREEAMRTGKPLPRKAPSLAEKVASLLEKVKSLRS